MWDHRSLPSLPRSPRSRAPATCFSSRAPCLLVSSFGRYFFPWAYILLRRYYAPSLNRLTYAVFPKDEEFLVTSYELLSQNAQLNGLMVQRRDALDAFLYLKVCAERTSYVGQRNKYHSRILQNHRCSLSQTEHPIRSQFIIECCTESIVFAMCFSSLHFYAIIKVMGWLPIILI